jgi:hypothetical protein
MCDRELTREELRLIKEKCMFAVGMLNELIDLTVSEENQERLRMSIDTLEFQLQQASTEGTDDEWNFNASLAAKEVQNAYDIWQNSFDPFLMELNVDRVTAMYDEYDAKYGNVQ